VDNLLRDRWLVTVISVPARRTSMDHNLGKFIVYVLGMQVWWNFQCVTVESSCRRCIYFCMVSRQELDLQYFNVFLLLWQRTDTGLCPWPSQSCSNQSQRRSREICSAPSSSQRLSSPKSQTTEESGRILTSWLWVWRLVTSRCGSCCGSDFLQDHYGDRLTASVQRRNHCS